MSYVVLARKYRPARFADLVGQEATARTLQNAIRTGRVAHAHLFVGPRGLGKTTTARLLARAMNCAEGPVPEPCGACDACREIAAGTCVDVIEIDAASNRGIDEIRDLRERVHLAPAACRRKVYIIDEVHMLTNEAFNALLKTLEEPPAHVLFVLCTTEPQKVPETIRSRCQRFDFRPIPEAKIVERLRAVAEAERIAAETAALAAIARAAAGGMRDALSLLEQAATLGGGEATAATVAEATGAVPADLAVRVAEAVEARDLAGALDGLAAVEAAGHDLSALGAALLERLRGHLRASAAGGTPPLAGPRLVAAIDLVIGALDRARRSPHPAALWEAALARACLLADEEDRLEDLVGRLEDLERRLAGGVDVAVAPRADTRAGQIARDERPAERVARRVPARAAAPPARGAPARPARAASAPASGPPPAAPRSERLRDTVVAVLAERWGEVVEGVRAARGPKTAAFLKESRPAGLAGETLVIEFRHPFHRDAFAADPEGAAALAAVVEGIVGRRPAIETRLAGGDVEAHPTPRRRVQEEEPLVAAALSIFGGEVIGRE